MVCSAAIVEAPLQRARAQCVQEACRYLPSMKPEGPCIVTELVLAAAFFNGWYSECAVDSW